MMYGGTVVSIIYPRVSGSSHNRLYQILKPPFVSSDGRTVAIKRIRTKTFSLSKTIREEVKQVR